MNARLPLAAKDSRANLIRAFRCSGCVVCGRRYPEVDWADLHIDHIDPRNKPRATATHGQQRTIGHNNGGGSSVATILAELLHCQVLCVGCHKAKHRNGNATAAQQLPLFSGSGSYDYGAVREA